MAENLAEFLSQTREVAAAASGAAAGGAGALGGVGSVIHRGSGAPPASAAPPSATLGGPEGLRVWICFFVSFALLVSGSYFLQKACKRRWLAAPRAAAAAEPGNAEASPGGGRPCWRAASAHVLPAVLGVIYWSGATAGITGVIEFYYGIVPAVTFLNGFVIEFLFSIDNLILIHYVFASFGTPPEQQGKALNWWTGVGVCVRLLFYNVGESLFAHFHYVSLVLGVFVVLGGVWALRKDLKETAEGRGSYEALAYATESGEGDAGGGRAGGDGRRPSNSSWLVRLLMRSNLLWPSFDAEKRFFVKQQKTPLAGQQKELSPPTRASPAAAGTGSRPAAEESSATSPPAALLPAAERRDLEGAVWPSAGQAAPWPSATPPAGAFPQRSRSSSASSLFAGNRVWQATMLFVTVATMVLMDSFLGFDAVVTKVELIPNLFLAYVSTAFALFVVRELFPLAEHLAQLIPWMGRVVALMLIAVGLKMVLDTWLAVPQLVFVAALGLLCAAGGCAHYLVALTARQPQPAVVNAAARDAIELAQTSEGRRGLG